MRRARRRRRRAARHRPSLRRGAAVRLVSVGRAPPLSRPRRVFSRTASPRRRLSFIRAREAVSPSLPLSTALRPCPLLSRPCSLAAATVTGGWLPPPLAPFADGRIRASRRALGQWAQPLFFQRCGARSLMTVTLSCRGEGTPTPAPRCDLSTRVVVKAHPLMTRHTAIYLSTSLAQVGQLFIWLGYTTLLEWSGFGTGEAADVAYTFPLVRLFEFMVRRRRRFDLVRFGLVRFGSVRFGARRRVVLARAGGRRGYIYNASRGGAARKTAFAGRRAEKTRCPHGRLGRGARRRRSRARARRTPVVCPFHLG